MSKIQRYYTMPLPDSNALTITRPSDDGMFVLHSDHLAAMQAKDDEIAALRARLENAMEWEVMTNAAVFAHKEEILVVLHGFGVSMAVRNAPYEDGDEYFDVLEFGCERSAFTHFARIREPR